MLDALRWLGGWIMRSMPEMVSTQMVRVGFRVAGRWVTRWVLTEAVLPVIVGESGALQTVAATEAAAAAGCFTATTLMALLLALIVFIGIVISSLVIPLLVYNGLPTPSMPAGAPSFWRSGPRLVPDYQRYQRAADAAYDFNTDFGDRPLSGEAVLGLHNPAAEAPPQGRAAENSLFKPKPEAILRTEAPPLGAPSPRPGLSGPSPSTAKIPDTHYSVDRSEGIVTNATAPLDEARLQAQRVEAAMSGDVARYNRLVEEHKRLYKERGVDPCQSGFFPQGCSR